MLLLVIAPRYLNLGLPASPYAKVATLSAGLQHVQPGCFPRPYAIPTHAIYETHCSMLSKAIALILCKVEKYASPPAQVATPSAGQWSACLAV
mmetsp:Transcript_115408/g.212204  ORF Transcript_115408/g.212204 Transcript_115408/m.212204 type:complete len:93 (-) Transcript_115408:107-385(-)